MKTNNSRLTSTEITNLLTQFEQETMAICIGKHVLATVKDSQIRSLFQHSLEISEKHLKKLKDFFNHEKFPIPNGFTEKDINLDAPPLFTDSFWLEYLHALIHYGLSGYSLSLGVSVRRDIRDYFYQCNLDAMEIYNQTVDMLLSKGLYEPPPYFSAQQKVEYITNLGYTLDVIGKKRPLNTAEAGNIYINLTMTRLAKGMCLGFYHVTKNKEVRQYLEEVLNTINKNFEIFSSLLHKENLHVPRLLDTEVTNSTVAPFSDKLVMLKVGFLLGASLSYYGTALVAVVSDGAGSAKFSDQGSSLACSLFEKEVATYFAKNNQLQDLDVSFFENWIDQYLDAIRSQANDRKAAIREFACTLVAAVVGNDYAAFFQVGDGAIVILDPEPENGKDEYKWSFWPAKGEYENTTYFLTDPNVKENIQFDHLPKSIEEVSLLTDGIQHLALHYQSKTVKGLVPVN